MWRRSIQSHVTFLPKHAAVLYGTSAATTWLCVLFVQCLRSVLPKYALHGFVFKIITFFSWIFAIVLHPFRRILSKTCLVFWCFWLIPLVVLANIAIVQPMTFREFVLYLNLCNYRRPRVFNHLKPYLLCACDILCLANYKNFDYTLATLLCSSLVHACLSQRAACFGIYENRFVLQATVVVVVWHCAK